MKFIVDAQLPPSLASALRAAGYDAQAVREIGLRDAEDQEIWEYAIANRAGIITKDQDFSDLLIMRPNTPIVVWLRIGNTSNRCYSRGYYLCGLPFWIALRPVINWWK